MIFYIYTLIRTYYHVYVHIYIYTYIYTVYIYIYFFLQSSASQLEWCTDTAIHRNFCHVNFFRGFCPTVSMTGLAAQGMLEVLLRPVVVVFHPTTVLHLPWSGLPGARGQRIQIHRKQGAKWTSQACLGIFLPLTT